MEKTEQSYRMSLAHLEGISRASKNKMLMSLGKKGLTLTEFINSNLDKPSDTPFAITYKEDGEEKIWMPTEKEATALSGIGNWTERNASDIDEMGKIGIKIANFDSQDYPQQLIKMLGDNVPTVLYYLGDQTLLNTPCISMVGCRNASVKSLQWTDLIAKKHGVDSSKCVVSGYARGIDQQSFRSAVQNGGKAIVVLPQGIVSFLEEHKELNQLIADGKVLLLSSYPIHSPWLREQALDRNTHIYALGECTFVAESNNHGGTWAGANNALRKHWDVRVRIPDDDEENGAANKELIQKGAVGIDADGNIAIEHQSEEDCIDEIGEKVKKMLLNGTYTSKDIIKILGLDWKVRAMNNYLENIEGIIISGSKTKSYTLKRDLTLF